MPAKSAAQKRLFDAAAHNPAFAKKVGIPTKVAKEFSSESKGMKFRKGGEMKKYQLGGIAAAPMARAARNAAAVRAAAPAAAARMTAAGMKKGGGVAASKMGTVKTAAPSRDGLAVKGKTKGKQITMRKGGMTKGCK